MKTKTLCEMTNEEIWDGWCGSAMPTSDEGHFTSLDDAIDYVRDRVADWGNEPLDDEGRVIADMTEEEIRTVARSIYAYCLANQPGVS